MSTPSPQVLNALAHANEVRLGRAEIKRRLFAGQITLEEALDEPYTQTMTVFDLLMARRRWGRARALKVMVPARISEAKTVETLTTRQRAEILKSA